MRETHSFISCDYVKILNLVVSTMNGSMVINTPANGSVSPSLVCSNFLLTIYGKNFDIDLVCIPLSQLDVIMGMNWLESNHVHINCYNKSVIFPEFVEEKNSRFIFVSQVEEFLKDESQVYAMFASLKFKSKEDG